MGCFTIGLCQYQWLKSDFKLTVVGMVRCDKCELKLVFKNAKDETVNSSIFVFHPGMTAVT